MAAGYQNKAVINNGATWGTLPAINLAKTGVSLAEMPGAGMTRNDSPASGTAMEFSGSPNKGGIVAGDMTLDFLASFEHVWRALALFCDDTTSGSGPTVHKLTPFLAPTNPFIGLYVQVPNPDNDGGTTRGLEVPSFAGSGFELTSNLGEVSRLTVSGIPHSVKPVTAATIGTATFPATNSLLTMEAGDTDFFQISNAGSALANLGISGFTFSWSAAREGGAHSTTQEYVGVPDRTGTGSGELVIRIPGLVPVSALAEFTTPTERNALVSFPSKSIGGVSMTAKVKFPRMILKGFDPAGSGSGSTTHELTYRLYGDPDAAAVSDCDTTGGTPWEIEIGNSETTDYNAAIS